MSDGKAAGAAAEQAPATAGVLETNFDLSSHVIPYLDRHMVLPLIDFLMESKQYDSASLQQAKLELVSKTKMVDSASDEHKKIHGTTAEDPQFAKQRTAVLGEFEASKKACGPLLAVVTSGKEFSDMVARREFTLDNLAHSHGVSEAHVAALYAHGRLSFEIGFYGEAANLLAAFRLLARDEDKAALALWGKAAAEILNANESGASEDLRQLRDLIDARASRTPYARVVAQRAWLVHWALFLCRLSVGAVRGVLCPLLSDSKVLAAVQTACPHVLRYAALAAVLSPLRRGPTLELLRVLAAEAEAGRFADPATRFVTTLLTDFDFEAASRHLRSLRSVLAADFFLQSATLRGEVIDAARALFFDTYARLHKDVAVDKIKALLDLVPAAAPADPEAAAAPSAAAATVGAVSSAAEADAKLAELARRAIVSTDASVAAAAAAPAPASEAGAASAAASSTSSSSSSSVSAAAVPLAASLSAPGARLAVPHRAPSVHQQLRERTRAIAQRSQQLAGSLDKRAQAGAV